MLSGFLDKLVVGSPRSHDYETMRQVNGHLRRPPRREFQATAAGFARFVRAAKERGVQNINEHWRAQTHVCSAARVKYQYRLRLEEV